MRLLKTWRQDLKPQAVAIWEKSDTMAF